MKKTSLIIIALLIFISACTGASKKEENVLKIIGKEKISQEDLDQALEAVPQEYKEYYSGEDGEKKILDELVVQKILLQEALKAGIDKEEQYKKEMKNIKEKLLVNLLIKQKIMDSVILEDAELKAYYDENIEEFKFPESIKASHILIKLNDEMDQEQRESAEKQAMEILKKATTENFSKLAMESSQGPSRENGGDLGWFTQGQMVKEFSDAAFACAKGEICPKLVETVFGLHIIYVEDRHPGEQIAFDEVKGEISQKLILQKRMDVYQSWIEDLKEKYLGE